MDRSPKQTFLQEKHTYGQKAHEKMPNIIKEMQIKAIMRYHLIPVRMAFIKKSTNSKYLWGCQGKINRPTLLVGT